MASPHDFVLSDASFTPPAQPRLLSPPENWPACFKEDEALRSLLGKKGLKSRRCRLVETTLPADVAEKAAKVKLHPSDSFANAQRIKQQLGWSIVKGFAVFEFADCPHQFVAHKRWWNNTPFDAWVDLTPEKPAPSEAGILLAESDLAASQPNADAIAAEKRAEEIRKIALAESKARKAEADEQGEGRAHEKRREKVMGEWKHHTLSKRGRTRFGLSPSGKFALESETWSREWADLETQDDFFDLGREDLDPSHELYSDACQMQVKGTWELGIGMITFKVVSVECFGPAEQYLPLKPEQVARVMRADLDREGWIFNVKFQGGKTMRFDKAG